MSLTKEVEIHVTVEELAAEFCELLAKDQALFFCEVARLAQGWESGVAQWHAIGRVLANTSRGPSGRRVLQGIEAAALEAESARDERWAG